MKNYRQSKTNLPLCSAAANAPIYFTYDSQNDPKQGTYVAKIYDREGKYLGFTSVDTVKKYLYGQLYYKTKKAYGINFGLRGCGKRKYIIEKATNKIALLITFSTIDNDALLDPEAPGYQASQTLARFRGVEQYNLFHGVHDPFKLITNINEEMRAEAQALVEKYNKRIRESLESQVRGENDLLDLAEIMLDRAG